MLERLLHVKKLRQNFHNGIKAWNLLWKYSGMQTYNQQLPNIQLCLHLAHRYMIYDLTINDPTINMICNICNNRSLRCLKCFTNI